jgi:hypothetical protein
MFRSDLGHFALYLDEEDVESELLFYEIIDDFAHPITDELKLRRVQKWFDERYSVE